jgi:formamidopyrimidine-DNA glycosylase
MPELPELTILARQMDEALRGKRVATITIRQAKCANVAPAAFAQAEGTTVRGVSSKGKWLAILLDERQLLLISLGMGADLLHLEPPASDASDPKSHARVLFSDGSGFSLRFWWFGKVHLIGVEGLPHHPAGQVGPSPLDERFTPELLGSLCRSTARAVKKLLLDQHLISGIGNAYVHDILFLAGIHPLREASALADAEIAALHSAMKSHFSLVISKGGLAYEKDFFGRPGGFTAEDFLVGYRAGQPCPRCGAAVVKLKTGQNASYVCPSCQPLRSARSACHKAMA